MMSLGLYTCFESVHELHHFVESVTGVLSGDYGTLIIVTPSFGMLSPIRSKTHNLYRMSKFIVSNKLPL